MDRDLTGMTSGLGGLWLEWRLTRKDSTDWVDSVYNDLWRYCSVQSPVQRSSVTTTTDLETLFDVLHLPIPKTSSIGATLIRHLELGKHGPLG